MKKFEFHVEQKEKYFSTIIIEADKQKTAIKLLSMELVREPLERRKNTFEGTETRVTLNGQEIDIDT